MKPLRATLIINAPEGAVRRALGRTDTWTRTATALGARLEVAGTATGPCAPLRPGDLVRICRDRSGSLEDLVRIRRDRSVENSAPTDHRRSLILRVGQEPGADVNLDPITGPGRAAGGPSGRGPRRDLIRQRGHAELPTLPALTLVAGPLRECRISLVTAATAAGTLATVECRAAASPPALTPWLRPPILRAAQMLLHIATLVAREPVRVVGGAIIIEQRVLAARRAGPPEVAGLWELPGGKVEPGETDEQALRRELVEELGVDVSVGRLIGPELDLGDNTTLRCYRAQLTGGRPRPTEHDAVRWLGAAELDAMDWLPADRLLLGELRSALLASSIGGPTVTLG